MTNSQRELAEYEVSVWPKDDTPCLLCGCTYNEHHWGIDTGIVKGCPCGKCISGQRPFIALRPKDGQVASALRRSRNQ